MSQCYHTSSCFCRGGRGDLCIVSSSWPNRSPLPRFTVSFSLHLNVYLCAAHRAEQSSSSRQPAKRTPVSSALRGSSLHTPSTNAPQELQLKWAAYRRSDGAPEDSCFSPAQPNPLAFGETANSCYLEPFKGSPVKISQKNPLVLKSVSGHISSSRPL